MKPYRSLIAVFALSAIPLTALAQNAADLKPAAYAIREAKVVVEPGTVLPKANIVIRDGFIVAIGADAVIPADAAITEGKGLTVYPGFIDAGSLRGFDPSLRRSQTGAPSTDDIAADGLQRRRIGVAGAGMHAPAGGGVVADEFQPEATPGTGDQQGRHGGGSGDWTRDGGGR